MITGTVRLDLSRESERHDRRAIGELYGIPAGSRVILHVGDRRFTALWTVEHLRQYVDSLHFDVQGTTAAVAAWVHDLRAEGSARSRWLA